MGERHVTLLTGPPCSGKTTHARQHAADGDLIVDFDTIAAELGSDKPWNHTPEIRTRAEAITRSRMSYVRDMADGCAWVIRSVPNPYERVQLAKWLAADRVLVLLPEHDTLRMRMQRRPQPGRTLRAVNQWMRRYSPAPGDEITSGETQHAPG